MYTVGPGTWQENFKTQEMRHTQCRKSYTARKTENHGKREMHTVGPGV